VGAGGASSRAQLMRIRGRASPERTSAGPLHALHRLAERRDPACRDGVIPAEHEEQGPLLVVELEGALAVEMNDLVGVERDGIAGRARLYPSPTFRVIHPYHLV